MLRKAYDADLFFVKIISRIDFLVVREDGRRNADPFDI